MSPVTLWDVTGDMTFSSVSLYCCAVTHILCGEYVSAASYFGARMLRLTAAPSRTNCCPLPESSPTLSRSTHFKFQISAFVTAAKARQARLGAAHIGESPAGTWVVPPAHWPGHFGLSRHGRRLAPEDSRRQLCCASDVAAASKLQLP